MNLPNQARQSHDWRRASPAQESRTTSMPFPPVIRMIPSTKVKSRLLKIWTSAIPYWFMTRSFSTWEEMVTKISASRCCASMMAATSELMTAPLVNQVQPAEFRMTCFMASKLAVSISMSSGYNIHCFGRDNTCCIAEIPFQSLLKCCDRR